MCCKNKCEDGSCKKVGRLLSIIGLVVVLAGIAYAIYRYCTPDYLEDFDDDEDLDEEETPAEETPAASEEAAAEETPAEETKNEE